MSLTKKDIELISSMIRQAIDNRTNTANPFKSNDRMDGGEYRLKEAMSFDSKDDDDGPPIGSDTPTAT